MKAKFAFFAFLAFVVLSLASGEAFSQVITVQSSTTLNATTQASNPINLVGTGTTSFTFTWNTTGTVSAGACRLEWSNVSGPPWTQLVAPVTVTSSGGPSAAAMVVNYVRFNCTTPIVGTGSVQFRYVGTMTVGVAGTGSDVNITNPSLVVAQSNPANLNATVTGTITANAGTGFAGVAQGSTTAGQVGNLLQCAVTTAAPTYTTGQTNPCSLDTSGGLRVSGIAGGGGLAQGSTTPGQLGTLIQAAATTAAPTYTTGTTNPLSLDLTGALRVNVVAGAAAGGTSSSFSAAFPATGTAAGFSDGTNMQGARVFDVDSGAGLQYVQGVSLRLTGAGGSVEFGTAAAPIRVDPSGTTTQPVSGTGNFTVVQPTGTNLHAVLDATSTTAVTQATAANLNATVFQPTGSNLHVVVDSAPTTAVTGTVIATQTTGTNLHVVVDSAPTTAVTGNFGVNTQGSATAGQSGQLALGAVTTAAPSYTTGQSSALSLDVAGNLRVAVTSVPTTNVNLTNLSGVAVDVNSGNKSAGTQRFVLATDQPNLTTALNVSLGATTSNMNISQIGTTATTAVGAAPNAKLQTATFDSTGQPITAVTNPCDGTLTTLVSGSITADTQIIGTAGAGIKRYYCSIAINNGDATTAEKVSIVESTTGGGTCTVAPSLVWGSTTDSGGWYVASAGGGFISETLKTGPLTNAATCLKVNTGGLQIDYIITYVQQ